MEIFLVKNYKYVAFDDLFLILSQEGDIIAYCLDIIDSLGCPGLSSFRVYHSSILDFT